MAKKTENKETIVDIGGAYSKGEDFFNRNKKVLAGTLTVLILVMGGYIGYTKFIVEPAQNEASSKTWKAQYHFSQENFDKAIEGDGVLYPGMATIAAEYGSTRTGSTAAYYLGLSHLHKGNYQAAIEVLESVSLEDEVLRTMAIGNVGDAYLEWEQGSVEKALSYYQSAIDDASIDFTKSYWMFKKAQLLEFQGNSGEAMTLYQDIKDNYSETYEARQVDKYLARAEAAS